MSDSAPVRSRVVVPGDTVDSVRTLGGRDTVPVAPDDGPGDAPVQQSCTSDYQYPGAPPDTRPENYRVGYAQPRRGTPLVKSPASNPRRRKADPTQHVTLSQAEAKILGGFVDPRAVTRGLERAGVSLDRMLLILWEIIDDPKSRRLDRQRALETLLRVVWKSAEAAGLFPVAAVLPDEPDDEPAESPTQDAPKTVEVAPEALPSDRAVSDVASDAPKSLLGQPGRPTAVLADDFDTTHKVLSELFEPS